MNMQENLPNLEIPQPERNTKMYLRWDADRGYRLDYWTGTAWRLAYYVVGISGDDMELVSPQEVDGAFERPLR